MSKSMKRVERALTDAGLDPRITEMGETRTAAQAAAAVGCEIDQIAKSIIFHAKREGAPVLFLTAGGNRVDDSLAEELAGEPLGRADAALVRSHTGFAIGGVAPVGHLNPIRAFLDPRLTEFDTVWAAAGTPRHVFPIAPENLKRLTRATVAPFCR